MRRGRARARVAACLPARVCAPAAVWTPAADAHFCEESRALTAAVRCVHNPTPQELFYGVYNRDADRCLEALITMGVLVRRRGGQRAGCRQPRVRGVRRRGRAATLRTRVPGALPCPEARPPNPGPNPARPRRPAPQVPTGDRLAVRRTAQFFLSAFSERLEQQKKEKAEKVGGTGVMRVSGRGVWVHRDTGRSRCRGGAGEGIAPPPHTHSTHKHKSTHTHTHNPPGRRLCRGLQAPALQGRGQGAPQGHPLVHRRGQDTRARARARGLWRG